MSESSDASGEPGAIVVAFIPEDDGLRALDRAADLAQRLELRLHVMAVVGPLASSYPLPAGAEVLVALPPSVARDDPDLDEQERVLLQRANAVIAGRAPAVFHSSIGDPAHEVADLAHELGAELVVVGDHKRGFLSRLLERNVAHAVTETADCDVLVVRPRREPARNAGS